MKKGFFMLVLLSVAFLLGCSEKFVISKDGKTYFFASKRQELQKMLCDTGDLRKVLANTLISEDTRNELYRYNCEEPSAEKMQAIYTQLTVEQRRSLRKAFMEQGYKINQSPCAE